MKTDINSITFSAFRAFALAMSGSFVAVRETVTSRTVRVELSVPRFRGESFASFLTLFDGSETIDADGASTGRITLGKPEKDFLRSIFECSDAALAELGAQAGRVRFAASSKGRMRIEATGGREMDASDSAELVAGLCAAAKAALAAA